MRYSCICVSIEICCPGKLQWSPPSLDAEHDSFISYNPGRSCWENSNPVFSNMLEELLLLQWKPAAIVRKGLKEIPLHVWCHISYQSSNLPYIFFGQNECKQVDNTAHPLCKCSKNPPKTGVTIIIRVVGGLAKMGAAQQQVRGRRTASGVGCDLLHQILTGMPSNMTRQAGWHLPFREKVRASEAWHWPLIASPSVRQKPSAQGGSRLLRCVSCGEITTGQVAFFTALVGLQPVLRAALSRRVLPCLSARHPAKRDGFLLTKAPIGFLLAPAVPRHTTTTTSPITEISLWTRALVVYFNPAMYMIKAQFS